MYFLHFKVYRLDMTMTTVSFSSSLKLYFTRNVLFYQMNWPHALIIFLKFSSQQWQKIHSQRSSESLKVFSHVKYQNCLQEHTYLLFMVKGIRKLYVISNFEERLNMNVSLDCQVTISSKVQPTQSRQFQLNPSKILLRNLKKFKPNC